MIRGFLRDKVMQTALRKMGNSTGMILPKPILTALGLSSGAKLDLELNDGRVIVTPVKRVDREGWAEAAKAIGAEPMSEEEEAWLNMSDDFSDDWTW
jgi:antitoxin MazE